MAEGWVERRRGLGTFVVERPLAYLLHREARFSESLAGMGRGHDSCVLRKGTAAAAAVVAERLGLEPGATVFRIDTARSVDGRPMSLITHWLPCVPLPDLARAYTGGSLHGLLQERYGLALRRAQTVVAAVLPSAEDARLLRITRRQPVLRLSTVNVDADRGTSLEYAVSRCRADRMELTIDHDLP